MANDECKKREQGILNDLKHGRAEGFRITPEDRRDLLWEVRDAEGKSEPLRGTQVFGTHTLTDVARQAKTVDPKAFGWLPVDAINNEIFIRRANTGMNFGPSPLELLGGEVTPENFNEYKQALHNQSRARKASFLGGSLASDVVQDSSRSIWWLFNAAQVTTIVINEQLSAVVNPDLFANRVVPLAEVKEKGWVAFKEPQLDPELFQARVQKIRDQNQSEAFNAMADGYLDIENLMEVNDALYQGAVNQARAELLGEAKAQPVNYKNTRPGVKIRSNRILKRRFNPNLVTAATLIPAGIGINAGIGLLGRNEGYAMTVPKEVDPFSTDNAVAEVAACYLAGREGRLLEAEEFLLERPDVTYGEYQKYKGYLRDRYLDLNPFDDGKIIAGGQLKTNPDGIRGAEVSFTGKTLPLNDNLLGVGGSILGGSLGAALTNLGSIRLRGGVKARKGLGKLGRLCDTQAIHSTMAL